MGTKASPTFVFSVKKASRCFHSNKNVVKCNNQICKFLKDRISELPDEIIVSILSRLTVKEAARTSILAHRWENMWKFITILNLDDPELNDWDDLEKKRQVYSRMVNQALESHHAPNIQECRIPFDLMYTSTDDIDNWIHFAFQKRVRKLELDFSSWDGHNQYMGELYTLNLQPLCLGRFNCLSTLRMKEVDANDEVFEYLLANSPFLEKLSIEYSHKVVNLKITGPSPNLKYLKIVRCAQLKSIEISAIDLVSFKYVGGNISFSLQNVLQLAKVSFRAFFDKCLSYMAHQLSSYLPQLKKLILDLSWEARVYLNLFRIDKILGRGLEEMPKLPELSNLRHLKLIVAVSSRISLPSPVMHLLDVCPLLHRFTLKIIWSCKWIQRRESTFINVKKRPLPYLKVVELLGFVGDGDEMEVAMNLLENAVSLEKLVIRMDFRQFQNSPGFLEEERLTRECAMMLGAKLPARAEFILLQLNKDDSLFKA